MTGIHLESHPPTWAAKSHASLDELIHRASTTSSPRSIGLAALLIQSLAVLEPAHAYLRLTRSPVSITAAQVASRLMIVWCFLESSTDAQSSPFYASMLLAWSAAELLRSTYYLLSLLHIANVITTLRYTAFYLLYPVGAGSEYALILKGFPAYPSKQAVLRSMGEWAWLRVPVVLLWPASLFILMSYMHKQRKSALGKGPGRSIPGGKLRDVGGKKRA
ncbi:hypothetical protein M408DRAFT_324136 [Serendipita vermifera MAFF 305830]|uniref:Very-long-chain (3R)-3-hydroxyacyl-CoA dehydratase n=1 Tax=Serendipita vermifera MAFF 305830 TaxID=933852 RepID=A0A0C3AQ10_SERVB|nr:hypothetical protein M408DRAFT_324136 [Serendipita vermifera MAFF 305830]